MKILCIGKPTEAMRMLPPEIQLNLFESFLTKLENDGEKTKVLEMYTTPIGYSVTILDYDTAEEWVEDQKDLPILNYIDFEIYPLADGISAMKRAITSLRKAVGK